ncbi:tyrosine recombinase [Candidatus Dependentiae bacterium]
MELEKESILEFFESFLLAEKRASINTCKAYLKDIGLFFDFLDKHSKMLEECSRSDIENFLKFEVKRSVSSRSVARRLAALKTFSKFLSRKLGVMLPVTGIDQPRWAKPLPKYLSEKEIKAIFDVAKNDVSAKGIRNLAILSLLYSLGLRVSELTSLKISQLRLGEGFVSVVGKGEKERTVPITGEIKDLLDEYISNARQALLGQCQSQDFNSLFFSCSRKGARTLTRQAVSVIFQNLAGAAGIEKKVSPHVMRHSIATHLLGRGADLRTLQTFLGHENIATVQIYTHVDVGRLRSAYDKKHPRS